MIFWLREPSMSITENHSLHDYSLVLRLGFLIRWYTKTARHEGGDEDGAEVERESTQWPRLA